MSAGWLMRATMLVSDAVPPSGSDGLFAGVFARGGAREEVGDRAWLQGMLDFEAALAHASARAGVLAPARRGRGHRRRMPGGALRRRRAGPARGGRRQPGRPAGARAHRAGARGAPPAGCTSAPRARTSLDTAAMLVARRALGPIVADLAGAAEAARAAGGGAPRHRARRAHAAAAGAAGDLRPEGRGLARGARRGAGATWPACASACPPSSSAAPWARSPRSATTASAVAAGMAERLGLAEPTVPWHTIRTRPAALACALGVAAGRAGQGGARHRRCSPRPRSARPPRRRRGPGRLLDHAAQAQPGGGGGHAGLRRAGARARGHHARRPWPRSTSAPPAPGRRSGRRWSALLRLVGSAAAWLRDALEGLRGRRRRACARTSTSPAGC